jgi:hypothetical protein
MSVKFQITLPDDLAVSLKRAAAQEKMPLAGYIRITMAERLNQRNSTSSVDPFASITGLGDETDVDLAARVDEILYK